MKLISYYKKIKDTRFTEIKKIICLKKQHWPFAYQQQYIWWKRFSKIDDEFLFFKYDKKIVSFLRLKKTKVLIDNNLRNFRCITEVCVDKKFSKKGLGKAMINLAINILKIKSVSGFLLCYKNQKEFYEKCKLISFKNIYVKSSNTSKEKKMANKRNFYFLNFKNKIKKITLFGENF